MGKFGNARIVPKEFVSMVNAPGAIEHICQDAARELIDKVIVEARKGECTIKLTEEQFDRYNQNAIELRETIEIHPLVRCGDCKYWDGLCWRLVGHGVNFIDPNGFCSYGERKEDY